MTDPIISKEKQDALSERMPLRRRDFLQGAAIGAAAIATVSPTDTEAAGPASKSEAKAPDQLIKSLPSDYDPAYVKNAVIPFLQTRQYEGERPALPMLDDVQLSKDFAITPHIFGLFYDSWKPNPEGEGVTVFMENLDKRGPNNLKKKIYVSALTPDLYGPMYSAKIKAFFDRLLDNKNAGQPLLARYLDGYFDLYWDLHLGVKGDDIPKAVRQFSASFNSVLAYRDPRKRIVYENYMKARELRAPLKKWIGDRLKDIANGKIPDSEKTIAYYWIKNGEQTELFREKNIVFECLHNLVAMSQWGVVLYLFMEKFEEDQGDRAIRAMFAEMMKSDFDNAGGAAFTPLDRFVMELFRTIPINPASISSIKDDATPPGNGLIRTPHMATNLDPRHWEKPQEFNPERYLSVPTSNKNDKSRALDMGFATCPYDPTGFQVKDGRQAELTNSAFGAVYGVVDGKALPVCDYAGYAPFGFSYRRCAGELLNIEIFKDFFRKVSRDKIVFHKLKAIKPKEVPVGIRVMTDDIGFSRETA